MRSTSKKVWIALTLVLASSLLAGYYYFFRFRPLQYYSTLAREALDRRDFEAASGYLQKRLALAPDDLDNLLLVAQTARRGGDFQEADRLRKAAQTRGGAEAFLQLEERLARLQQGDMTEADFLLDFCLENPDSEEAYFALEAIVAGTIRALPQNVIPPEETERGSLGRYLRRGRRAAEMWLKVARGPADEVQGLVWRGRLRLLSGQFEAGLADLRAALEKDPDHFNARFFLAGAVAQGSPEEAAAHLELLRKRHPDNRQLLVFLANVRRNMGQFQEAADILDQLLRLDSSNINVVVERALVAIDARDEEAARSWVSLAELLRPDHPEVHLALSRYARLLGKESEASEHYNRFLELKALRDKQQRKEPG